MTSVHIDNPDYAEELQDLLKCGTKYAFQFGKLITKDYTFTFSPEYEHLLKFYEQFVNPLIYGKNTMLGVVAVEVVEETLHVFFFDGTVKTYPYKNWILTPGKEFASDERLDGFLHYKYIHYTKPGENTWRIKDKFQIWGEREAAMTLHGITLFKGMKPSQLKVLSFDIESSGLEQNEESDVFIITNAFQHNGTVTKKHFRVDEYENAGIMIEEWCKYVQEVNPDVIVGHNIYGYDLPYLSFVAGKFNVSLHLGRDSSEIEFSKKSSEYRVDGNTSWTYSKSHIFGRHIIDGMFLAVKYDFAKKYPSWGLKPIVEFEGLQKPGRTFYDASLIRKNWHDPVEREKIVAYAVDDSEDSLNLYNLMIPAYFYMCQSLPMPFEEMMQGSTGKWMNSIVVRSYLQDMRSIPKADEKTYVHGGISFGNPRLYKNVYKVDVTSLYPSCILTYNIYPEKKDPDQNFLKMVRYFTDERIRNKKQFKTTKDSYYDDLQAAQKIAINSSYGMLGTNGLVFNDFHAADSVTRRGRGVLRRAIIWASGKDVREWYRGPKGELYDYTKDEGLNEKVFIVPKSHNFIIGPTDTDSISFCKADMSGFSEAERITFLSELNSIMDPGIVFEDDGYYSHILAVAAKNYILRYDDEYFKKKILRTGKEEQVTMKGSSIKDAKKEPILREFMNEVIEDLLYETRTIPAIYDRYCNHARNIKDIALWSVKKSISKKLLASERKQELDVVNALGDVSQYREGDKVFLYACTPKWVPELNEDGSPALYKSGKRKGEPKGEFVKVLKLTKDWNNDADTEHYLFRVYSTLGIFEEVLDMSQYKCYTE